MSHTINLELPVSGGEPIDLESGSILFVGTATVILRYAGFTVLTDPNFLHAGDHAHLGYGITAERRTDPAMDIEDIPPEGGGISCCSHTILWAGSLDSFQ
jgi:hypothetical protein